MRLSLVTGLIASGVLSAAAAAQPSPPVGDVAAPPGPTPAAGDPGSLSDAAADEEVQEITADPIDPGAATVIQSVAQRVGLNVFGDATFIVDSEASPHSTFELGAIGVIMNAEFTETLSAINEIAFEFAAGDDGLATPVADVERLQIQYNTSRIHVAAGRLHTELGYWNTAYHHGRWLQLPVERPHAVQFEDDDGALPIHTVGVEASYLVPVGDGSLRLLGGLGNGRGRIEDDVLTVVDTNEAKAILVKVEANDLGRRDLHLGVSAMFDRIAPFADRVQAPTSAITEVIANGFVAYRGVALIAIAEAYAIVHAVGDDQFTSLAGFGLVGWDTGRYVPYGQLEYRNASAAVDPFYSPRFDPATPSAAARSTIADDLIEVELGVRIELSDWSVIKLQAELERLAGATTGAGLVNWSFGI